jgi:protein-tyrosine phosphatase
MRDAANGDPLLVGVKRVESQSVAVGRRRAMWSSVSRILWIVPIAVVSGCGQQPAEPVATAVEPPAPERHVVLDGQPNFRDLGGYETVDGRTVTWGEIFRSGELPHLTDEDVAKLEELEIRTVVNFLLPEEIEMNGRDRLPEGVREVPEPIQGDRAAELTMAVQAAIKAAEFDNIPPEMNPEFHRLLLDEGKDQYAALLRQAADPINRPLVFHCSHGVHRTGTAAAILLSALGVPWETVRQDYLLTNEYRAEEVEAKLATIRQQAATTLGVAPEQVDMTNVEAFYILEGSYIDGTLDRAVADHGSMEAYIRDGLGITDEEVARLRDQLLQ